MVPRALVRCTCGKAPRLGSDPVRRAFNERERRPGTGERAWSRRRSGCAAELAGAHLETTCSAHRRTAATAWRRPLLEAYSAHRCERLLCGAYPEQPPICYFDYLEGEALVIRAGPAGALAVSSGAACSSGAVEPSPRADSYRSRRGARPRQYSLFAGPGYYRRAGGCIDRGRSGVGGRTCRKLSPVARMTGKCPSRWP